MFSNSDYSVVSDDECEKRGLKQKLTEQLKSTIHVESLIKQAEALRESTQGDDRAILDRVISKLKDAGASDKKTWRLPIGRYDNLNGNKRIYPKQLWQNVMDKQRDTWQGIAGLADHPEKDDDPGDFKNSAVVWLDMEVPNDGVVYGIGRFVGPHGALAEEIIEAGGRIGLSSSGFGDVDKKNNTVDPNTYIIERLADVVINPSQDVYASVDCTHTPEEFMKNVTQGATIEFERQKTVRESIPQSAIYKRRMNEMSQVNAQPQQQQVQQPQANQPQAQQNDTKVDAAAAQNQNQEQQPSDQQAQQQQPVGPQQGQQPQKESMDMAEERLRENALTKVEEKAFRKYVSAFIDDMGRMENPIHRLNEATEILSFFTNGNCPDLREKLEEQIVGEKQRLEKLIETTVKAEQDFGVDIGTIRENAEKITEKGIILNEQVTDYKALVEELAKRNQKLVEANRTLTKKIKLQEKLQERVDQKKNREIVGSSAKAEKLAEEKLDLGARNKRLQERIGELSVGNKSLEKDLGLVQTKLREAVGLLKESKAVRDEDSRKLAEMEKTIADLRTKLEEGSRMYDAQGEKLAGVTSELEGLREELRANDPQLHVMPKSDVRIGKFLNLREGRGTEVEDYWFDLCEKYGEDNLRLFEHEIRDAKTLREATSRFLKYRTRIDPDFAVAQPINQFAYRNRDERAKLMEHQGIPVPRSEDWEVEAINADFERRMNAAGLR